MARVGTSTSYVEVEGDYGSIDGVQVTCDRCGHWVESAGTESGSIRRCGLLLRESCPRGENNFYELDD